jgi:hypothetical protein
VKQVLLQENKQSAIMAQASFATLKTSDPVHTCVLKLCRGTLLHLIASSILYRSPRCMRPAYVPPEAFAHRLEATVENDFVCFLLVYLKSMILTSLFVEEEVAERWVK